MHAAAAVGVGRGVGARLVDDVLDLLMLLADLDLARRRQRRGAARAALVGVGRADDAEHVAAVRHVAGDRSAGSPCSRRALLGMAVRVMAEHERHRDVVAVDRRILGIGDRDLVLQLVPEREQPAVQRRGHVTVGLVLPAVMIVLVDVRLPEESITVSTAVKRPRWCRCASGWPRWRSASRHRSPTRSGSTRPDPRPANPRWRSYRQRRGAVGPVGGQHRLRRALALDVIPPVHAGVRVDGEEPVTVGQQVERAVRPELHVHRVVALEQERAGRGVGRCRSPGSC